MEKSHGNCRSALRRHSRSIFFDFFDIFCIAIIDANCFKLQLIPKQQTTAASKNNMTLFQKNVTITPDWIKNILNLPTTKLIAHFFLAAFRLKTLLFPSNLTGLVVAGLNFIIFDSCLFYSFRKFVSYA